MARRHRIPKRLKRISKHMLYFCNNGTTEMKWEEIKEVVERREYELRDREVEREKLPPNLLEAGYKSICLVDVFSETQHDLYALYSVTVANRWDVFYHPSGTVLKFRRRR